MIYLFVLFLATAAPPAATSPYAGPHGTVTSSTVIGNYAFMMAEHPSIASCERARRMTIDFALTLDERTFVSKCAAGRDAVEYHSYRKRAHPPSPPVFDETPKPPSRPGWEKAA